MALATNFKPSQNITVLVQTEATIGSGTKHASSGTIKLPMIAPPTIIEHNVPLDIGSQQVGSYVPNANQMTHRKDNAMWEIQLQFMGNNHDDVTLMEYITNFRYSGTKTLQTNYIPADMTYGATNGMTTSTLAQYGSAVIYVSGVSFDTDAEDRDYLYLGCVMTGWSISHSIDANGGYPVITATFVTGFKRTTTDVVSDGSLTPTSLIGDGCVHWSELNALAGRFLAETNDGASSVYDIRAYGYNINISRDIQRVGFLETTDYKPFSYEQVGGISATGDVTFKSDDNFYNARSYQYQHSGFEIAGTGYTVRFSGMLTDTTTDTGSPEIRKTMSFQASGNINITGSCTGFGAPSGPLLAVSTSPAHGLQERQRITISGTDDYNDSYYIQGIISPNAFYISDTDQGTSTGTWVLHADSMAVVSINL
tara:strand:- start:1179 stop:2450 length:1272 start_codon:yes stop_codon:yes gene_type:complete